MTQNGQEVPAALRDHNMLKLKFNYFQDAVNAVLALCLATGLLLSLAHIAKADHGSQEETCSICGLFNVGITLIAIHVVFHRAALHWIGYYFAAKLHFPYPLSATGRSPPLL
jgi:hypothetical protein